MSEFFKTFMIGYMKFTFEKEHGRPPKCGEITSVKICGKEVELTEEDLKSTWQEDLVQCGFGFVPEEDTQ